MPKNPKSNYDPKSNQTKSLKILLRSKKSIPLLYIVSSTTTKKTIMNQNNSYWTKRDSVMISFIRSHNSGKKQTLLISLEIKLSQGGIALKQGDDQFQKSTKIPSLHICIPVPWQYQKELKLCKLQQYCQLKQNCPKCP